MGEGPRDRLKRAVAALKAAGAREVYVFGSAASGTQRGDSDIDLAIAGLPPEKFFQAMAEAGNILGRPVDLVDLDEKNLFTDYLKKKKKLRSVVLICFNQSETLRCFG